MQLRTICPYTESGKSIDYAEPGLVELCSTFLSCFMQQDLFIHPAQTNHGCRYSNNTENRDISRHCLDIIRTE